MERCDCENDDDEEKDDDDENDDDSDEMGLIFGEPHENGRTSLMGRLSEAQSTAGNKAIFESPFGSCGSLLSLSKNKLLCPCPSICTCPLQRKEMR
ncbi:hypothetical protein DPMN_119175 [Dreissena polymorpha]|uniref:Uncharacterized protein n=1 Tax=Dreissena polymorpha TaxID=45954 RepID=A0A9D4JR02_DREPO|nr:hypothetical protein DPMN_119175 [Dreissena polymorpha]